MALVVGYDRHPASRAAVLFACELAGALNVPVHVVHVVDISDGVISGSSGESSDAVKRRLDTERRHVGEALDAAHVRWEYHLLNGEPVKALLKIAEDCAAILIVVGRPQHGIGPTLSHIVSGTVTRNLLRRSTRPVAVVPEFADSP
ncbi:universal stress protein [Mycobacterium vicinigordonae]|uniref:Universal stress protein n=1 Tax=Mycobacterium vicinigordonae TaxID=1719132 RepID=A0A7D6DV04_9MYCO|nr:universal stress protein [Mycobacterium vicinigordonae]QLL05347.1 universal stress protein [Mycobacterium vicinigordonae]